MELMIRDFNGAESLSTGRAAAEWSEIERALRSMPLHLKASDQRGIVGRPIFDPVGTNQAITAELQRQSVNWKACLPIPSEASWIGTDVDYGKARVLIEAQFSNYPFLMNNLFRLELIERMQLHVLKSPGVELGIIVTKGGMFPASNSTLYYEQAIAFVDQLARLDMFKLPVRLVGLMETPGNCVTCVFSDYGGRYGREVKTRRTTTCTITRGRSQRCTVILNDAPASRS